MSVKQGRIYALVSNKKQKGENIGSLAAIIDEYIQGDMVTQNLLKKFNPEDTLVIENVTFLGANVHEVVNALNTIADYKINLCLAQENISFKADKLPNIASSLLLAFRLHQSLISQRSKTALQDRKAKGVKLGRPYGCNPGLKLDDHKEDIRKMLLSGVSKDVIAEKYNVCRSTVYNFVRNNPELFVLEAR
jgi:DNA invertase Pin-like site-specific DNA recombinase